MLWPGSIPAAPLALLLQEAPPDLQEQIISAVSWIITIGVVGFFALVIIFAVVKGLEGSYGTKVRIGPPPEPEVSDTHGTADFAPARAGIPDPLYIFQGVFFGKSSSPGAEEVPWETHQGAPICSLPESHSILVARTRSGKATRCAVPTLLRNVVSSCLCVDPKGELAAITARARQNPFPGFTQTVHIINPWGELGAHFHKLGFAPASYNPLDILDRHDPNVVATAQALAAAICPREKSGKDAYWNDSAASVLTAVLLWLTDQPGETKTLGRTREIVTLTRQQFKEQFLVKMAASSAFEGAIRENAAPFIDLANETYSGVMSNLAQHTRFLSDPQVKRATATSSFSMQDLINRPTTVYLVIPPDRMETQRTWLRLMITAGTKTYMHRDLNVKNFNRCMLLIDEFPALGKLDLGIATAAGYGIDYVLIIQGIDQLKEVYGDAHATILSNCAFKWFCNVNDLQSAEYLSKTLGKKTVATRSTSENEGGGPGGRTAGSSTSRGETGRALLMPDEILNLGRDTAILLAPGEKPHYLRTVDYWKLQEAFITHSQMFPQWYWDPPMKWDENPLPH